MARLLLLLLLGFLVYLLIRGFRRSVGRDKPLTPVAGPEDMVRCSQCGVHLPKGESFTSQGKFYCSDEHRRLDQDR